MPWITWLSAHYELLCVPCTSWKAFTAHLISSNTYTKEEVDWLDRHIDCEGSTILGGDFLHGGECSLLIYIPDNCVNEKSLMACRLLLTQPQPHYGPNRQTNLLVSFTTHQKVCGLFVLLLDKSDLWVVIFLAGEIRQKLFFFSCRSDFVSA